MKILKDNINDFFKWVKGTELVELDDIDGAEEECAKWNTGVIVDFDTNMSVDKVSSYNDIRPFSFDERQRTKERKELNRRITKLLR